MQQALLSSAMCSQTGGSACCLSVSTLQLTMHQVRDMLWDRFKSRHSHLLRTSVCR